jgi:AraC-like DNA-binding protein
MNTRLNHIQNWAGLAREANWSTAALAKKCGVSVRTLERCFLKQKGKSPKTWLAEQRHLMAIELLHYGSSVKEVAGHLGYKNQHHFSREFKKQNGYAPSQFLIMAQIEGKNPECRV